MSAFEDLARDVTVLILGGGRGTRLAPLTTRRSKPAVPIAGKYRLIDIPISNAIISGMERMYVLTQFNSVSLHRHISRTYRFDAFSRGSVSILAAQQTPDGTSWFQGTADAVRQNINIVRDVRAKHVLILAGDHMYRMDYRQLLHDHVENNADITIGVMPCSEAEIAEFGAARVDDSGRVLEFREKPKTAEARAGMEVAPELLRQKGVKADQPFLASMGIYLFKREALLETLNNELVDFGGDIIPAEVPRRRIQAHFFKGYWRDIGTIDAYWEANMDLVNVSPQFNLYDRNWPVRTLHSESPPPKFVFAQSDEEGGRRGMALDSIVSPGCIISGGKVEGSVLSPDVRINSYSYVFESLLFNGVKIGRHCRIRRAIIDKDVNVPEGTVIGYDPEEDKRRFKYISPGGIVVIPKGAHITPPKQVSRAAVPPHV